MINKEPPDTERQLASSQKHSQDGTKQEEVKENPFKMLAKLKKEKQMQAEKDNLDKERGFSQPIIGETLLSHGKKTKEDQEKNLMIIPPNFQTARLHAKSSKVFDLEKANENNVKNDQCPCCDNILFEEGTEISMNCDAGELASLGTGFALYYEFFKSIIQLLLILSLFVSMICILLSVSQTFTPKYISMMKLQKP